MRFRERRDLCILSAALETDDTGTVLPAATFTEAETMMFPSASPGEPELDPESWRSETAEARDCSVRESPNSAIDSSKHATRFFLAFLFL